jgi:hypothetical protein
MIEYRFRVPSAAIFTLYSYSKALEYPFRVPTAGSLMPDQAWHEHEAYCVTLVLGCAFLVWARAGSAGLARLVQV